MLVEYLRVMIVVMLISNLKVVALTTVIKQCMVLLTGTKNTVTIYLLSIICYEAEVVGKDTT